MNRREFFRGIGAAAAAFALEPVPFDLLPPMPIVRTSDVYAFIFHRLAVLHGIDPSTFRVDVSVDALDATLVHVDIRHQLSRIFIQT
jgi:hypothetical protein